MLASTTYGMSVQHSLSGVSRNRSASKRGPNTTSEFHLSSIWRGPLIVEQLQCWCCCFWRMLPSPGRIFCWPGRSKYEGGGLSLWRCSHTIAVKTIPLESQSERVYSPSNFFIACHSLMRLHLLDCRPHDYGWTPRGKRRPRGPCLNPTVVLYARGLKPHGVSPIPCPVRYPLSHPLKHTESLRCHAEDV
jgi:hypothetical protein